MAHIAPFRALRYDPARVDLSQVVTQPYDKITPEMQERYYAASPHNLVRIILGKREAADRPGDNPYTRAAAYFQDWRRQGVFLQEAKPSIYSYAQHFTVPGGSTELERQGFIALGQLEDYADGVVFRHEQTLAKPKADRLDLLRATRAHFGQLFMLYSDPAGEIDGLLTATTAAPEIETRDEYGVRHRVSTISDPDLIDLVRGKMRDKKLIVADGHHRYETALNYRNERNSTAETAPGPVSLSAVPPYEMVMMTFINMDSPGLLILPTHRVVHGLAAFSAEELRQRAGQYFSVEEVDPSVDAARASGILREAGRAGTTLMAVTAHRVFLLDTPKSVGSNFFSGLSIRQQALDVVQLHKCLLEGVLGISEEAIRNQQNISYVRDASEAMARVRSGEANVAFLMNPVRMRQVRDIAFAGEVLPQKSTDFYPKLLSGLTIYALE
ncbi:MAG TPA: DUF1015 domain-containing protein [Terriglobales bacterium]|jgi:uncharacterized protein (DUF1015 family)|nr:DUF1015 domain-containing protein [Terriglobales bacterium]